MLSLKKQSQKRELLIDLRNPELLEMLAQLEHEQWSHWVNYVDSLEVTGHLTEDDLNRWKSQATMTYEYLTEQEKESDREWARKVLDILSNWWWRQH